MFCVSCANSIAATLQNNQQLKSGQKCFQLAFIALGWQWDNMQANLTDSQEPETAAIEQIIWPLPQIPVTSPKSAAHGNNSLVKMAFEVSEINSWWREFFVYASWLSVVPELLGIKWRWDSNCGCSFVLRSERALSGSSAALSQSFAELLIPEPSSISPPPQQNLSLLQYKGALCIRERRNISLAELLISQINAAYSPYNTLCNYSYWLYIAFCK